MVTLTHWHSKDKWNYLLLLGEKIVDIVVQTVDAIYFDPQIYTLKNEQICVILMKF